MSLSLEIAPLRSCLFTLSLVFHTPTRRSLAVTTLQVPRVGGRSTFRNIHNLLTVTGFEPLPSTPAHKHGPTSKVPAPAPQSSFQGRAEAQGTEKRMRSNGMQARTSNGPPRVIYAAWLHRQLSFPQRCAKVRETCILRSRPSPSPFCFSSLL